MNSLVTLPLWRPLFSVVIVQVQVCLSNSDQKRRLRIH